MAASGAEGRGGGGGCTTVAPAAFPPARPPLAPADRVSRARENLLSTLQDRAAPLQAPLPRLRLTGRGLTDLSLMSGGHRPSAAGNGNDDVADFRRGLGGVGRRKATGGRGRTGRGGDVGCMTYTELRPPRDLTYDGSTPRDTETTQRSRQAALDAVLVNGVGQGAERGGCEGRLDYAQMPVTLTQLHRIMTSDRKTRHHHTVPVSGPGSDRRQYDTDLSDPQRPLQASNKTNIRISIKRETKGETPAVRLTMKVTLPNIAQPPTTPSTDVVVKRRERLPAFVERRRRVLAGGNTRKRVTIQCPPNNGVQTGVQSVTYPDDCDLDDVRSVTSSSLTPAVLRHLDATRGRPVDRTRRWLAENPVEELPVTPVPPSSPTTPPPDTTPSHHLQPYTRPLSRPRTQSKTASTPALPPAQSQVTYQQLQTATTSTPQKDTLPPTPQRGIIKMRLKTKPRPNPSDPQEDRPSMPALPPPTTAPPGDQQVTRRVRLVSARGPGVVSAGAARGQGAVSGGAARGQDTSTVTTMPLATSTPRVTSTVGLTVRPTVTATYRTRGVGKVKETEL